MKPEYIYAYDPKVKMRTVHAVINGWAVSLVTGDKFRYKGGKNENLNR